MGFICRTCGGECKQVSVGGKSVYKCGWCGNEYAAAGGEAPAYKPYVKSAQKDDCPRTMPEITSSKRQILGGDEVYERNINSVIELRTVFGGKAYSGSGYAVAGGLAVTNAHVVTSGGKIFKDIKAYVCGGTYPAEVVKLSADEDLALIKISGAPSAMRAVKFADVSKLKNGQRLYVLGNSMGGGTCITGGVVSDKRRTVLGKTRLMTDCAVNKGNSGGPAFNDAGEVVGTITEVTSEAEGMNYAIPSDVVVKFLSDCGVNL